MSYLRYLCLLAYIGVQHIFFCEFSSSCVPYVASFSGLSIFVSFPAFSNAYL